MRAWEYSDPGDEPSRSRSEKILTRATLGLTLYRRHAVVTPLVRLGWMSGAGDKHFLGHIAYVLSARDNK